jgi:hypothetical protein
VSQHLKDKILNYEVAPPQGIWDSIAFELDKDDSVLPIAEKIGNYEVAPPAMVWSKIEEALDKENTITVAEKLGSYEVAPPVIVWSKIESALDKEDAKVIEFTPKAKVFNFYKLAAAASVLLIITTSVWFFTNNNNPEIENTVASNTGKQNNTASVTPNSTNGTSTLPTADIQEKEIKNSSAASVVQKEKTSSSSKVEEMVGTNATTDLATNPFENKEEKLVAKNGDVPENIDLISTPNTYLTIVGPNGQSVRISSKFSKQIGLFTEKDPDKMENIDFIIEESAKWRGKIATWRDKMNAADVSPSPHNFMDIIELSKKIDSKRK